MRIFSTEDERNSLLYRLQSAPKSPEIEAAIRIVDEAIEFAEMRALVTNVFKSDDSKTFEEFISDGWMHHSVRALSKYIDNLYQNIRLQRFKSFVHDVDDYDIDEDGYIIIR